MTDKDFKKSFNLCVTLLEKIKLCIQENRWTHRLGGKGAENNIMRPDIDLQAILELPHNHPVNEKQRSVGDSGSPTLLMMHYKHTKFGKGIVRPIYLEGYFRIRDGCPTFSIPKIEIEEDEVK